MKKTMWGGVTAVVAATTMFIVITASPGLIILKARQESRQEIVESN